MHIGSSLFMVIIKFFVPNKLVDSIRTVSYLQTDSYCLRILEGPLLFSHFVEFLVLSKLKRNSNHIIILYIFFKKKVAIVRFQIEWGLRACSEHC